MTYPQPTIIAAINAARATDSSDVVTSAARMLVGHSAAPDTLDAARDQGRAEMGLDYQAQAEVEG